MSYLKFPKNIAVLVSSAVLVALFSTNSFALRPRPPETIRVLGDPASLAVVGFPLREALEGILETKVSIIGEMSPLKALELMDKGEADAYLSVSSLDEINREIDENKIDLRNRSLIQQYQLILENISYKVIVNPKNSVKKLSKKELRRIFSGRYKNWDDVDGADMPLNVVMGDWGTGTAWVLQDKIMEDDEILKSAVKAETIQATVEAVSKNLSAIAVVPASAVNSSVKVIEAPELSVKGPFILISISFPTNKMFQLIKYIKGEGIPKVGF